MSSSDVIRRIQENTPNQCHWPKCDVKIPHTEWACEKHWKKLPRRFRDRMKAAHIPGYDLKINNKSRRYLAVVLDIQRWIEVQGLL